MVTAERILRFVNSLPVTSDPLLWVPSFRDALLSLLGDVDWMSVSVNFTCDLQNPEGYQPQMSLAQHVRVSNSVGEEASLQSMEGTPAERVIDNLKEKGFPVTDYYPPDGFTCYLSGAAYLGTVILWRRRSNAPISAETLQLMEQMEPFLVFLLSDLIARRQHADPDVMKFNDALQQLADEVGLSRGEQRVVLLQLFGNSLKDIADVLNVSVDGVKHHLKMIHRKTGTRSYTELFAKYFMPRLGLQDGAFDAEHELVAESTAKNPPPPPPHTPGDGGTARFDGIETIAERLRYFGKLAFPSVQDFARAMKMAPANLQKYLGGAREPGPATLARLLALGCNLNGLFGGRGEAFADNTAGNELRIRQSAGVTH